MRNRLTLCGIAILLATSGYAQAEPAAPYSAIDPNTFILGHPASPRWKLVHANFEHPAVIVARNARSAAIDANTFIVQPPTSVTWLPSGEPEAPVAVAAATGR